MCTGVLMPASFANILAGMFLPAGARCFAGLQRVSRSSRGDGSQSRHSLSRLATEHVALTAAKTAAAGTAAAQDAEPLLSFRAVRSFARFSEVELRRSDTAVSMLTSGESGTDRSGAIVSFKEILLHINPVDFTAQESFFLSVLSFVARLPLQDIWQVCSWILKGLSRRRIALHSILVWRQQQLGCSSTCGKERGVRRGHCEQCHLIKSTTVFKGGPGQTCVLIARALCPD
jgi:hypothetical protein